MRLATVLTDDGHRVARVDGAEIVDLGAGDLGAFLARPDWRERGAADGPRSPLDESRLAPVVPRPGKIICLGLNYAPHIREMGHELPDHPTMFAKFARALVGPRDPIRLPATSDKVDWEAELALVIGRVTTGASPAEAADAIAGYTVCNDVSVRDFQRRTSQWLQGKTFDATTPLGPWLVTPDEVGAADGATPDLEIRCEVDGEVRQRARTGELLFGPAEVVAYVSGIVTLDPGDVIATGTPGGVGAGRDPQVWLRADQEVRTVVEGIGELVNRCERAA